MYIRELNSTIATQITMWYRLQPDSLDMEHNDFNYWDNYNRARK